MTRRARRPLDPAAVAKADDAFYAEHPEMVSGGKRIPISSAPIDPCTQKLRDEWLDGYAANGGALDPVTLPPCKPGQPAQQCTGSVGPTLTDDQAKAAFDELAANKNIPFDYPVNCCYSRAHSMCQMLEKKGIPTQKYWLYNKDFGKPSQTPDLHPVKPDGSAVSFPDKTGFDRPVQWVYHVAPTVKVEHPDGSVEDMVMDPSLADRPLTKAKWRKIQGDPAGTYDHTSDSDAYFTDPRSGYREDDPDLTEACEQMHKHKLDRDARNRAKAAKAKKGP